MIEPSQDPDPQPGALDSDEWWAQIVRTTPCPQEGCTGGYYPRSDVMNASYAHPFVEISRAEATRAILANEVGDQE